MADHLTTSRGRPLVAAGITAVVCLIIVAVLTSTVVRGARRDAEESFEESATQTAAAVEQQLLTYLDELRDIAAFAANAPDASPEEFDGFVRATGVFEQLPSLVGVLFLEHVPSDDLDAFVASRQGADPGFALFEIGPREPGDRYVLTYYVPGAVDLALPIGTDVTPISSLTQLIDTQAERGEGVAGSFQADPYLQKVAEDTAFPAVETLIGIDFFVGVPAFSSGAGDVPAGELLGWVGAPVDEFDDVLAQASEGQPSDLGLSLTIDLTDTGFGDREDLERAAVRPGTAGDRDDAAFELTQEVEVDGVDFSLTVWSTPGADNLPASIGVLVLGGVAASLLVAAVVYLRLRARERDRAFTQELRDREHAQRDILDSVSDAMVLLDREGRLIGANPAWWKVCARASDQGEARTEMGTDYVTVASGLLRDKADELGLAVARVLDGRAEAVEVDVPIGEGDGHRWYAVRVTPLRGRRGGAVVVHSDITDRKRSHDELAFRATRDDLTGLLNRHALEVEIDRALARARARATQVAVLFVDLDGFKPINDRYGHAVGDEVLRAVARRLTTAVRGTDRVARFGGDEFVVLVAGLDDRAVAEQTAERILRSFDTPVRVEGLEIPVAVSVGVAVVDGAGAASREELINAADAAMYRAKQDGGRSAVLADRPGGRNPV